MIVDRYSLNNLGDLLDEIHDRYFWIDQIEYDENKKQCTLFLGERRKGPFNKIFRIEGVESFICEDSEGVGQNSINKIEIDLDNNYVELICNIPAKIGFYVKENFRMVC